MTRQRFAAVAAAVAEVLRLGGCEKNKLNVFRCFGLFLEILGRFRISLYVLGCFLMFLLDLGCFGMFWDVVSMLPALFFMLFLIFQLKVQKQIKSQPKSKKIR